MHLFKRQMYKQEIQQIEYKLVSYKYTITSLISATDCQLFLYVCLNGQVYFPLMVLL